MNKSKLFHKVALAGGVAGMVGASLLGIPQEAKAGTAKATAKAFFSDINFSSNFGIDLTSFTYSTSCNADTSIIPGSVANSDAGNAFTSLPITATCTQGVVNPAASYATSEGNAGVGALPAFPTGPIGNNSFSEAYSKAPPTNTSNATSEFSTITAEFVVPTLATCLATTAGSCQADFRALLEPYLQVDINPEGTGSIKFAEAKYDAAFQVTDVTAPGPGINVLRIARGDNISVQQPPVGPVSANRGVNMPDGINNGTICNAPNLPASLPLPLCLLVPNSGTPVGSPVVGSLDELFTGTFTFTPGNRYQVTFNANTVARTQAEQVVEAPEPSAILGLLAVGGLGLGLKRKKQS